MGTAFGLLFGGACLAAVAWIFHHYLIRLHDARQWLSRGALLIDVDTPAEFYRHHPRVAVNVPLENISKLAERVVPRNRAIVVFAHSWKRGAAAVHELRGLGFETVMNAAGLHTKEIFSRRHASTEEAQNQHPDLVELSRISQDDLLPQQANAPRNGGTDKHDTSLK